jgi:hypothetical protein
MPEMRSIDPKTGGLVEVTRDPQSGAPIFPEVSRTERIATDAGLGSKRATFSEDQMTTLHEDMMRVSREGYLKDHPHASEAEIGEHLVDIFEKINDGRERDGLPRIEAEHILDPEDQKRTEMAGVAASASEIAAAVGQASRNANRGSELTENVSAGLATLASDLNMGREIGTAFALTVNSEAQRVKAMTPEARRAQLEDYQTLGVKIAGSLEAFKQLRAEALSVLNGSDEISKGLRDHPVLSYSPGILSLLRTHKRALDFVVSRGRKS